MPRLEGPVAIGQQKPPVDLLHGQREARPAQQQTTTLQALRERLVAIQGATFLRTQGLIGGSLPPGGRET